jgi:hypothetical protein
MAHSNNKNMATAASLLTEILDQSWLLSLHAACTPARGRHQLHFLPMMNGKPSANTISTAVIAVEILVG